MQQESFESFEGRAHDAETKIQHLLKKIESAERKLNHDNDEVCDDIKEKKRCC